MPLDKEEFKNLVIYIRTSTEEQNPENQLKDCESIRPKGQKQDTFQDYRLLEEKESAWKEYERPVFMELIKWIKQRRVKDVIVWDLDRLYRNRKKLISFFELCKVYGCKVHSYRQKWLEEINNIPSPWNDILHEFMINMLGWLAEDESNRKSLRVKSAIRKTPQGTKSYKGNTWGRKPLSTFKKNKIIRMNKEGVYTIRDIAHEAGVSVGAVHKIVSNTKE